MPTRRGGPPFHMTDMIRAEPALAGRLLARLATPDGPAAALAEAIRAAASAGRPVLVVGCGTSEHGAQATAEILRDAYRAVGLPSSAGAGGSPVAAQAFEVSLDPGGTEAGGTGAGGTGAGGTGAGGTEARGLVIAISHEGATWATNRALDAARAAGATTAIVTVGATSPGAALADIVVTTEELDQSWCHTVGYLSPILVAAAVGAHLGGVPVDPAEGAALLAHGSGPAATSDADRIAGALARCDRLIVLGSGVDRISARELTLKVEEGAHQPAAMRDLETFLHGHLAAVDGRTGVILLLAEQAARGPRTARAISVLRACRELDLPVGAILAEVVAEAIDPALTPAGRLAVPDAPTLPAAVAGLLATVTPLQVLAERLAITRGVDPDPIRRDDPRYAAAAAAAE